MRQRVYYVSLQWPWRPITVHDAEIVSGKKFTWAELPNGKRALLGASAFFMLCGAERRRTAALKAIYDSGYQRHFFPYRALKAKAALGGGNNAP